MQSEWRLYSICRREKNKGDQFLISMKLFRVTGVLVSGLEMIAKKERKNQWDRKIICHTQQEPSEK